ncbi:MAG: hypothetical protein ABJB22_06555 [Verrucomicrobiota bacterium]
MNDFSELETELRKLRPAAVPEELTARIERALSERPASSTSTSAVSRRKPGNINWRFLGFGIAAAAALTLLAKVGNDHTPKKQGTVAVLTPSPVRILPASAGKFIPTGMTQVVYGRRDEGLVFAEGEENPVRRRLRYRTRETLQWQQPDTGASLRVSYPSEEVVLMPVSGQ